MILILNILYNGEKRTCLILYYEQHSFNDSIVDLATYKTSHSLEYFSLLCLTT